MDTGICTGRKSNDVIQETSTDNNGALTAHNVVNAEVQSIIEGCIREAGNLL